MSASKSLAVNAGISASCTPLPLILPEGHTRVTWDRGLASAVPFGLPAVQHPQVFALRQRAALFGHNAPDPRLLNTTGTRLGELLDGNDWKDFQLHSDHIDLDTIYAKIVPGSWVVLVSPTEVESSRVKSVTSVSRAQYALSAKVTRIVPDLLEQATALACATPPSLPTAKRCSLPSAPSPRRSQATR